MMMVGQKPSTLQANNNFNNKPQPVAVKPTQLANNIIKDTPGKDSDDYEDDAAYDEDFDEDEEETFKKTAADFAKQLNELKTVNDKRKEIVEKMERDVVKTTNQVKPLGKPAFRLDEDDDEDEFDKEFN